MTSSSPSRTIVVPTKNRSESVARLVEVIQEQTARTPATFIIVDDGSEPPLSLTTPAGVDVRRTGGVGPASARNLGWQAARSDWIVFLDDDVIPQPGWWEAVRAALVDAEADGVVAVEGRVVTDPIDLLYERSVWRESGGWGLTCNVAYRRSALEAVRGFDVEFPSAHCEDLDLFLRLQREGPTRFCRDMVVEHFKRPFGFRAAWRRGTWGGSEMRLARKHPGIFSTPRWVPVRALPVYLTLTGWVGVLREERRPLRARRLARLVALFATQCLASATTTLQRSATADQKRNGPRA